MKIILVFLTALNTSQPLQEPAPPRDPPVKQKIEAVFFRNEAEEYFRKLRLFGKKRSFC